MELFIPGRLCILGEHTDWAAEYMHQNSSLCKGHTIVCATNEGLYAHLSDYKENSLKYDHIGDDGSIETFDLTFNSDSLESLAKTGGFFSYVYGTVFVILQNERFRSISGNNKDVKGLYINNYRTTLPMQKGLSSSAAICVLVASSFNVWYSLGFSEAEIMELAYQGEMKTPSHCGRMDQCVVMGSNAIAIMEFENNSVTLTKIPCAATLFFIVVDLLSHKDTVKILKDLNDCFPFPKSDVQALMHEYVHGIEKIAKTAKDAIETGDVSLLAQCMNDSQILFDRCAMPNCKSELTSPKLHQIMNDLFVRNESLAIKGVGSQGDGSAQILCENAAQQNKVLKYLVENYNVHGFILTISGQS